MAKSPTRRSNEAWIRALRGLGHGSTEAVRDLEAYLRRVLARAVHGRFPPDDLAETVQESLAHIVNGLDSFRGDSAFTTWAAGVATRVAFTELRRRAVRASSVDAFEEVRGELAEIDGRAPDPPDAASRTDLLQALEHAIATRLTERQRLAILAELRGVPTVEIAERLDTSSNALYKLTHDARRKLEAALRELGFDAESLSDATPEVST